jgi:hypothetical protein
VAWPILVSVTKSSPPTTFPAAATQRDHAEDDVDARDERRRRELEEPAVQTPLAFLRGALVDLLRLSLDGHEPGLPPSPDL